MTASLVTFSVLTLMPTDIPAMASLKSSTAKTHNVTSAYWGNVIVGVGKSVSNSAYIYTWALSTGTQYTYADLINVGGLSTSGNIISVTTQDDTSSRQDAPAQTFSICTNGTWNQTNDTCSGTMTVLGTVTNGTLTTTLALAAAQRLTVQIKAMKTKKSLWTSTFSIGVSRSQVRVGKTTNS